MALNPDLPVLVPGELITAQYNNDQRANLLRLDTDVGAARVLTSSTDVSGGNAPQGITTLAGQITIPSSSVTRLWSFAWNYYFSGHAVGSQYRMHLFDVASGAAQALSGYATYVAGQPYTGMFLARLVVGPQPARTTGFRIEIVTANANTNVAGACVATGIST